MKRWAPWGALVLVLVVALVIGARPHSGGSSASRRIQRLESEIRCPTCRSQSVADSDSVAAKGIRTEIERRVKAGESDAEIRAAVIAPYGDDILLKPKSTGLGAVVWALPVAALIVAIAGLGFAFRRWRVQWGT